MGHSRAEKAESHDRILAAASVRLREAGPDGLNVAELMAAAGLTHGGFYRHFASREALVEAALGRALEDSVLGSASPAPGLRATVNAYLSRGHRDGAGQGCAIAAVAGDAARTPGAMRAILAGAVRRFRGRLAGLIAGDAQAAERRALAAVSTLVGAVILARAVDDPALSDEILASAKASLLELDTPKV